MKLIRSVRVRGRFASLGATAVALLTLALAQPAAAACVTTSSDSSAVTQTSSTPMATIGGIVTPQMITWTPYDYAKITSSSNCIARMNWLKGAGPDITHWKCESFTIPGCPPKVYWMVMVGTNGI